MKVVEYRCDRCHQPVGYTNLRGIGGLSITTRDICSSCVEAFERFMDGAEYVGEGTTIDGPLGQRIAIDSARIGNVRV